MRKTSRRANKSLWHCVYILEKHQISGVKQCNWSVLTANLEQKSHFCLVKLFCCCCCRQRVTYKATFEWLAHILAIRVIFESFSQQTVARGEIRLTRPDLAERARAPASASSLWALRFKRVDETPDSPTLLATRDARSSVTRENRQIYPGMIHTPRIRPSLPFPSLLRNSLVLIQSSPPSRRLHVQLNLCYIFTGTIKFYGIHNTEHRLSHTERLILHKETIQRMEYE